MTVGHKNLTTTQLHEPKGAAAASDGEVYIADGAASGAWTSLAAEISGTTRFVGEIIPYAGSSEPTGALFSFGQAISRSTYSDLFAIVGTTYGVGDGSTTFNVPDLRGRAVAGRDDMGTVSANRLTDPAHGFGLDGDTLGDTGGEEDHTMTEDELVAHVHTAKGNTALANIDTGSNNNHGQSSSDTGSTGGSTAFNVVQPTIILNYLIFTGV